MSMIDESILTSIARRGATAAHERRNWAQFCKILKIRLFVGFSALL